MATDVRNIEEALDLLADIARVVIEVNQDGRVGILDLPKLATLWEPAKKAIEGIDQFLVEAKDIDSAEAQRLLVKAVTVGQAWMKVFTKAALLGAKAA